ncbi:MAG TPA: ATP synthase F1 subunit gamma [Vicinamibacterales bacterium]|nr:MAG: ATP synthase F1 subunit gamma [Acidobacteriota bacterium]PYR17213.1 MAG: ATP synthase F1 subunit gamma [Acidobacteriota bacterium]HMD37075.1 ATP synthase F1 subunit gamma [Vicinamibacterales bacterium]
MPSLIDLRRRIRAVKNTQQITKAMKMVAASKLRRAQERVLSARPYAVQMQRVLASVASRVDPSIHPLLAVREPRSNARTLVVTITGDKGLCGSFNTNVIKAAGAYIVEHPMPCTLGLVGRKGRDFFARRGFAVLFEQIGIFQKLRYDDARAIAQTAVEAFLSGEADRVMVVYNEFRSVMTQRVVVYQLLPVARADVDATGTGPRPISPGSDPTAQIDYLYEPSAQEIFNQLLPRYIEVQVYRALLESNAAFFAAQMTAMDTATKNSAEMIGTLTLYMNKVRQAAITREIIEVVSGAEAL